VIVLVLTACPEGLRGHLTRWLIEVSAGVFVGRPSARVRDELWDRVIELSGRGQAVMAVADRSEQGFSLRNHGHHWEPVDAEGITLMLRPHGAETGDPAAPPAGWSTAGRRRRYGR
jgi:CRISPR-associated protein Cas2